MSEAVHLSCMFPMPVIINPKNTEEYERERAEGETKKPEITAARWNKSEVKEGEEAELSAEVKDIGDGNMVTFQVWKEGQDPAAHIAQAQIPAGIEDGVAKGNWLYRLPGDAELPEQDPKWYFTVHSAWCPWKKSGNLTVELKRPELSEAKWLDKDGNGTGKGLVGEALKLSVVCNADTEEGAGVIFKVYPDGADPRYDQPVAELSSRNGGGKAEAEWTYRYEHDPENPLTEKPKYFFTVNGQRCKEVKSGNVEIGMEIDIPVCFDDGECIEGLEYTLVGQDGTEISEKTGDDGRIKNNSIIPAAYKINIKWDSYAPPDDTGPKFFDLDGTSDGVSKIYLSYRNDETTLELRPGQNYIIVVDKNGDSVST